MLPLKCIVVVVVLALVGGCAGAVEVTDGDRGLEDQNRQAANLILGAEGVTDAVKAVALDIRKNSDQLLKNFQPPKDKSVLKIYNPTNSEALRVQSEKEHKEQEKSKTWWMVGGSVVLAAAGWFLRSTSLGAIPIVGQLLAKISPRLANGAFTNERIVEGLQTAMDKGRDYYDKQADAIRDKIGTSQPDIAALIPTGEKLVELVKSEMAKRGVLPQNTTLYDANDTGVT
jgi:hypothetical protein